MSQCQPYATVQHCGDTAVFGLRSCTGSAFMLAICFRLPLSVAALHRSVQYDSGSLSAGSQPQRGGSGTEIRARAGAVSHFVRVAAMSG